MLTTLPNQDEKSIIEIPSLILNSQLKQEKPFVDFQVQFPGPSEEERAMRHYFESAVITPGVNRNMFEVTPEAMQMVGEGYAAGCPLSINHDKGSWDNTLGYGQTVGSAIIDGTLYVVAYLALDKTLPKGPFGSSNEIRDGIIDGFIGNVSQSIRPLKAKCSVCDLPYPMSYSDYEIEGYCRHYRGEQVVVEENGVKTVEIVYIIVEEAEAVELSLVMLPADEGSNISKPVINFSLNDFIDENRMKYLSNPENNPDPEKLGEANSTNEGGTTVSITQEQLNAALTRASNAEAQVATLNAEVSTAKAESTRLESEITRLQGEVNTSKAEKLTVEAEKATAEAKFSAEEAKVTKLEAEAKVSKDESDKKDARITELETEAKENEIVIKDGQEAREAIIERYADAYATAVGDSCTDEMKEAQRDIAKSFSIKTLEEKIEKFEASAVENFEGGGGRNVTSNGAPPKKNGGKNTEEEANKKSYPVGI